MLPAIPPAGHSVTAERPGRIHGLPTPDRPSASVLGQCHDVDRGRAAQRHVGVFDQGDGHRLLGTLGPTIGQLDESRSGGMDGVEVTDEPEADGVSLVTELFGNDRAQGSGAVAEGFGCPLLAPIEAMAS